MNDAIISGLFSLSGAIIGAAVSIFVFYKTMRRDLHIEIEKIGLQKEADLSIRLFDKKEAYLVELLSVLSTVRNSAIDIIELGLTDEAKDIFLRSKEVSEKYLNKYEKTNILYLPKNIRHEAAVILRDWKHLDKDNINRDLCKIYKRNIENIVEAIKTEVHRGID